MAHRSRLLLTTGLALTALLLALPWAFRSLLRHWEDNPVLRGRQEARRQGCTSCHLPYAGREIPNPGSRWGSVPSFQSGNARMYAEDRREIEEFILYGAPKAWLDDPAAAARLESQPIRMPAYGERLSRRRLDDLVAYASAVEEVELPGDDEAAAGRRLARRYGCLSCHGVEGAGGLANPGSLGGFVPGFLGKNFEHLVADEAEFREWVLEGTSTRLEAYPWIRYFWRRQLLTMPAYRDQLGEEELAQLWRWVQAARAEFSG